MKRKLINLKSTFTESVFLRFLMNSFKESGKRFCAFSILLLILKN